MELYPQEVLIGRGPTHKRMNLGTERIVPKVVPPYCLTAESAMSGTIVKPSGSGPGIANGPNERRGHKRRG
eukprot:15217475-Heterocapsa_arctica.AAC.1